MKILIISPGRAHDHTVVDGIEEYQKRIKKFGIEWLLPPASDQETEAVAILKALKQDDFVMLLDEHGKDIDTPGLAQLLDLHLQQGTKRLVVVIGGAFGVSDSVKVRARVVYKLSSLIFPHMLVRLIVTEQLYRAQSILDGGKYHHA